MEVPDWGWKSSSRYEYDLLAKKSLFTKFWLSTLSFQVQRTHVIFVLIGPFEDIEFLIGVDILI